jgi:hypothetical protein
LREEASAVPTKSRAFNRRATTAYWRFRDRKHKHKHKHKHKLKLKLKLKGDKARRHPDVLALLPNCRKEQNTTTTP